jgi:hypothetical protein
MEFVYVEPQENPKWGSFNLVVLVVLPTAACFSSLTFSLFHGMWCSEKLRIERRKEMERDMRKDNMKGAMRKTKLDRDGERCVLVQILFEIGGNIQVYNLTTRILYTYIVSKTARPGRREVRLLEMCLNIQIV